MKSQFPRVFSDDYVFRIPSYQRPYAWTAVQAGELFDDLFDSSTKIAPGRSGGHGAVFYGQHCPHQTRRYAEC